MHKYLKKIPLYLIYSILFGLFSTNSVSATGENITTSVGVQSSLTLTMPTTALNLSLDPSSTTFGYKDLPISVGTNNETGFTMTVSTANDNTDLVNTADSNTVIETLPTQTGGYTDADFIVNKWGYKNGLANNYFPFQSGATVLENDTPTNEKSTTLRFATKIDYMQPEGTYSTTFNFSLVANPLVDYIQDFTIDMCRTLASSADYTVVDKRDGNDYTIRYINGNCWMTKNLLFTGETLDPATSNVASTTSITYGDLTSGDSYDQARIHTGVDSNGDPTVWYNYAAASAMTITGSSNTNPQTYDVCPAGWRLPTNDEINGIISYRAQFNPVYNGYYTATRQQDLNGGYWWSSTVASSTERWRLYFVNGGSYNIIANNRGLGEYVRCVANDPRTISDISYMQDINSQIIANTTEGTTARLKDARDNQTYTVAKINGNVWMTQNLAIGCDGDNITPIELTPINSDVVSGWTTPVASLKLGDDNTSPRMECSSEYGAWYNYTAATAGTMISPSSAEASNSICPSGWGMPSYSQGNTILGYTAQFKPVLGGNYIGGSIDPRVRGIWWLSTARNTTDRYYLYRDDGSTLAFGWDGYFGLGFYLRCIAK